MKQPKQTECPCCGVEWRSEDSKLVVSFGKNGELCAMPVILANVKPQCHGQCTKIDDTLTSGRLLWECQVCGFAIEHEDAVDDNPY